MLHAVFHAVLHAVHVHSVGIANYVLSLNA